MVDAAAEAKIKELERKNAEQAALLAQQQAPAAASSSFDFGFLNFFKDNWFMLLITGGLFWYFTQHEQGKEHWGQLKELFSGLFESLLGLLPESWQNGIKAAFGMDMRGALENMEIAEFHDRMAAPLGLTKEKLAELIPTDADKKALVKLVSDANDTYGEQGKLIKKGEVNKDTFKNDKTIYALLTAPKFAPLVQAVAQANLQPGKDGVLSADAQKIIGSLRAIVSDNRLDTLLTEHKATTTALLKTLKPEQAAQIDLMMQHGSVAAGRATDAFRTLMTQMLTVTDGKLPDKAAMDAALNAYTQATPSLLTEGVKAFKQSEAGRPFFGNNDGKAYQAMVQAAGGDENKNVIPVLQKFDASKGTPREQYKIALQHRAMFDAYYAASDPKTLPKEYAGPLKLLNEIPVAATQPLLNMLERVDPTELLDLMKLVKGTQFQASKLTVLLVQYPQIGDMIKQAGPEDVAAAVKAYAAEAKVPLPASFGAPMILAMIDAAKNVKLPPQVTPQQLSEMTAEQKMAARDGMNKRTDTERFLAAVTERLTHGAKADKAIAGYITPDSLARFMRDENNAAAFWATIGGLKGLPEESQKMVEVLLRHKATITDLAGDVKNGAPLIIEQLDTLMNNAGKTPDAATCKAPGLGFAKATALWLQGRTPDGEKNSIGRNYDDILEMIKELQVIGCEKVGAAPATPARPVSRGNSYRPPASVGH